MAMKFEITDITHPDMPDLHRIRALRDIPHIRVRAGDLGGWIEKESNLDQSGDAWVSDNAWVFGNAKVSDKAWVSDNGRVCGDAQVSDNAKVSDNAWVFGNAWVSGNSQVFDNSQVSGNSQVFGGSKVYGAAWVYGSSRVFGDAEVLGDAEVYGNAEVFGNAWISEAGEVLHTLVMGSSVFPATLYRTKYGHTLHVGCWTGAVPGFRIMIESDRWVEATPEQIELRRPEMLAFTSMCEARIATWDTGRRP